MIARVTDIAAPEEYLVGRENGGLVNNLLE